MKNSFYLLLLVANLALGQNSRLFPPLNERRMTAQKGIFRESEFLPGKKAYGDKNLQGGIGFGQQALILALEGRFSHKTANGYSIYNIQLDHMPCSVPDKLALEKMPGKTPQNFQSGDLMPNAIPKVEMIPSNKKQK